MLRSNAAEYASYSALPRYASSMRGTRWQKQNKSLVKGCQMLREQSPRLAACLDNREALLALLNEFVERFEYGCSLNSRKKQPNSFQRIVSKRGFC